MNKLLTTAALVLVFALSASAADNKQQTIRAVCNQQAGDRIAKARKAFVRSCLREKRETPPQIKMASCNAQAKGLKGFAREKYMSDCLRKG